jgi:hypothetical protein
MIDSSSEPLTASALECFGVPVMDAFHAIKNRDPGIEAK